MHNWTLKAPSITMHSYRPVSLSNGKAAPGSGRLAGIQLLSRPGFGSRPGAGSEVPAESWLPARAGDPDPGRRPAAGMLCRSMGAHGRWCPVR